jgi:hypothetical protein
MEINNAFSRKSKMMMLAVVTRELKATSKTRMLTLLRSLKSARSRKPLVMPTRLLLTNLMMAKLKAEKNVITFLIRDLTGEEIRV